MKIEKINLPEEITSKYELKPIQMNRLNEIVLIAGKNGSGKTRFLRMLKENLNLIPNNADISTYKSGIVNQKRAIENAEREIDSNKKLLVTPDAPKDWIENIETTNAQHEANIKSWDTAVNNNLKVLDRLNYIKLNPPKENNNSFIEFVPTSTKLTDSYNIAPNQLDQLANNIYTIGTSNISEGTIPAIEKVLRSWANVNTNTTDDINISNEEKEKINNDYKRLREYIKIFLGEELKRTRDGYPEIFGKRIGDANLSLGQTILLQFCLALYAQEASLDNLIIFMDEPENHLHPSALIELLDKITPHVKNGQIWIATHSINILAHFDPSNIWYMDNGKLSYAGNVPKNVINGLLGNEEEIEKLSNFLSLPAEMASNKFAYESLFYPKVLITGEDDPQVMQIHEIIKSNVDKGIKLKVLDFGTGKGRLISTIYENERLKGGDVTTWLDFYGLDIDKTHKETCTKTLLDIYGNTTDRYFNESKHILAKHDETTFDFIIMCNVFHEIDPKDWLTLFSSVTSPFKLLKDDGYLLIVEDQFLAVGEKAYSNGFLVFDTLEFKKLFKMESTDKYHSTDFRKDGRLKSHHISKACINRIDAASRKEAIAILLQNAKNEIKKLRKDEEPSFKNGKLHGFWAQQLANAALSLEEL